MCLSQCFKQRLVEGLGLFTLGKYEWVHYSTGRRASFFMYERKMKKLPPPSPKKKEKNYIIKQQFQEFIPKLFKFCFFQSSTPKPLNSSNLSPPKQKLSACHPAWREPNNGRWFPNRWGFGRCCYKVYESTRDLSRWQAKCRPSLDIFFPLIGADKRIQHWVRCPLAIIILCFHMSFRWCRRNVFPKLPSSSAV